MAFELQTRCPGCAVPLAERKALPPDWHDGDPVPGGLTVHEVDEDWPGPYRRFVLRHNSPARVYLEQMNRTV